MKRLITTTLAVVLLLGLGALAVLARPGGPATVAPAAVAAAPVEFQSAAGPDGPAMSPLSSKYNMIALPLDVQANWLANSIPFDAQGLAQHVGVSSVSIVLRWDRTRQAYDQWLPGDGSGFVGGLYTETPFALTTGGVYRLLISNANPALNTVSFVGNVPSPNSVKFTLLGATACKYNQISIPLEQSGTTDADKLALSMGGPTKVSLVLRWDAGRQAYDQWLPGDGSGFVGGLYTETPFQVNIGYPYVVCLLAGANGVVWP